MALPLTKHLATLLDPLDAEPRAAAVLGRFGPPRRLACRSPRELAATGLLSAAEAGRIAAAFAMAHEAWRAPAQASLCDPSMVARALPELWAAPEEQLWVLAVDPGLRPLARECVARGGPGQVAATVAAVLRPVLRADATGFFLVHNHPSGEVEPSARDRRFTDAVVRAARGLEVALHDHLVVAGDRYASVVTGLSGRSVVSDAGSS